MSGGGGGPAGGVRTPVARSRGEGAERDPIALAVGLGRLEGLPALCALAELGPVPGRQQVRPAVAAALAVPADGPLIYAVRALASVELSTGERVALQVSARRCQRAATGAGMVLAVAFSDALAADAEADAAAGRPQRWGQRSGAAAVVNELAPALHESARSTGGMLATAAYAEAHLPAAIDAVLRGDLDPAQLRVLAAVARTTHAERGDVRQRLEAEAIRRVQMTPGQLEGHLRALAAQLDPTAAATAADEGREQRDVWLGRSPRAGCRRLCADLPELWAHAAWAVLNGAAHRAAAAGTRPDGSPEDRTINQLRADHLVSVLTGRTGATPEDLAALAELQVVVAAALPDGGATAEDDGADDGSGPGSSPGGAGSPPLPFDVPRPVSVPPDISALATVPVVVSRASLVGDGEHPGHVPGSGPLDAPTTRWLAVHARYRWLHVEETTGHLLHRDSSAHPPDPTRTWSSSAPPTPPPLPQAISAAIHHAGHAPGQLLRAHVEVRDHTCIGPVCDHPARRAFGVQLDHTINWGERDARGRLGLTDAGNLGPECRRVHQAKTHGGWQLRQPTPGTFEWTSPLGRSYTRRARPVLPGWTTLPREQR